MNIKPLYSKILVESTDDSDRTSGGIYLAPAEEKKLREGVVRSIGAGRINKDGSLSSLIVKVGDKVAFNKLNGVEIDTNLYMIEEANLLGLIE